MALTLDIPQPGDPGPQWAERNTAALTALNTGKQDLEHITVRYTGTAWPANPTSVPTGVWLRYDSRGYPTAPEPNPGTFPLAIWLVDPRSTV